MKRLSPGWAAFAIVSVAVYVSLLDTFIVNLAFPAIQADFPGTRLDDLSWIFTAYAIVFAALLVPSGRVADAVGRKRMFLIGLALFVASSAACALAVSPAMLVAARICQAAGAAIFTPSALAVVLPEFPPERRGAVFGAWAAVGGVGAASGPLLGSVLVQSDWRWIFLVNIPVGLTALAFGAVRLRESRDRAGWRMPDLWGTAGLIVAVSVLTLAIDKAGHWPLTATVTGAAVAVVILLVVVARSARHPAPALEIGLLRQRPFLLAVGAALVFAVAFGAGILAGAQFLTVQWHQSILTAGLQLSPGPIMAASTAIPAARFLAPRLGVHRVGAIGGILVAAGAAWLAWRTGATPAYASEILPAQIVTGCGIGMASPSFVAVALSVVDTGRMSTAIGISSMFQQMGNALGAAVFVSIVGSPIGVGAVAVFHRGWLVIAAIAIAAAALIFSSRPAGRTLAPAAARQRDARPGRARADRYIPAPEPKSPDRS